MPGAFRANSKLAIARTSISRNSHKRQPLSVTKFMIVEKEKRKRTRDRNRMKKGEYTLIAAFLRQFHEPFVVSTVAAVFHTARSIRSVLTNVSLLAGY